MLGILKEEKWTGEVALFLITIYLIVRNSEGHSYQPEDPTDYLLCRGCGADIADSSYIHNRFSSEALIYGNQSLFGKQSVAVQLLENPLGIRFRVLVVNKAKCIGVDEWHSEFSWYPGYAWKHCLCSHCGHHLGWIFEPLASAVVDRKTASDQGFYGLILDNLLTESFSDSLIIVPKSYKS
ncbi:protein cereblon homolog [Zootermopsis nevadensis]|uniref:Protein cereblon n=1 Tax=Zootermopsis nevadensis TaxID=136037 RepID=A0A067RMY0_ZOONE|nr:protein cereblon homolog [Zootermopsis nevadensis]KDR24418.1 Protein cereblon [Zootermopsis nevadensis]